MGTNVIGIIDWRGVYDMIGLYNKRWQRIDMQFDRVATRFPSKAPARCRCSICPSLSGLKFPLESIV